MWAQDSQTFLLWCLVCWAQLRPRCGFTHGPHTRRAPGKPSLCPEPSDCFSVPFTGGTQLHVAVTWECTGLTFAPRPPAVFSLLLRGPPAQPCPDLLPASVDPEIWIRVPGSSLHPLQGAVGLLLPHPPSLPPVTPSPQYSLRASGGRGQAPPPPEIGDSSETYGALALLHPNSHLLSSSFCCLQTSDANVTPG